MLPITTSQVNEASLTLDTSNYYEAMLGWTSLIWAFFPVRVWLGETRGEESDGFYFYANVVMYPITSN